MALRTRWEREAEKRGKKLGEEVGEKRGLKLGEAKALTAALLTLMQQKFGDLPTWAKDKLSHAELPSLRAWVEAVYPSKNIEAVFATQPDRRMV